MTPEEYIQLYQRYITGKCTPEEEQLLMSYKDSFQFQEVSNEKLKAEDKTLRKKIYHHIQQTISRERNNLSKIWYTWAAAATLVISLGIAFYFIDFSKENENADKIALKTKPVVKIDSATAVLTLSDGSVISLDEAANGILTHDGFTEISKTKDGELVYGSPGELFVMNRVPNKISIPKGNQYKLTLSDGTKVWLNSASTLIYPSSFSGSERHVELSGEGYFEVTKNEIMPFIVTANGVKVKVLGTEFNISAYEDDEFIKTTLAEGSVRLANNKHAVILEPGQQGIVTAHAEGIAVKEVNLKYALAWKEGYFLFKDDNIKDVMQQISRYYNVDIEYETNTQEKLFGGIYSKSKKLEELLKGLELTGLVKFRVEGRRIIVMN